MSEPTRYIPYLDKSQRAVIKLIGPLNDIYDALSELDAAHFESAATLPTKIHAAREAIDRFFDLIKVS